ncbi:MAG: hypothetical protein C4324_12215 [Blastocatellia bacterium]
MTGGSFIYAEFAYSLFDRFLNGALRRMMPPQTAVFARGRNFCRRKYVLPAKFFSQRPDIFRPAPVAVTSRQNLRLNPRYAEI